MTNVKNIAYDNITEMENPILSPDSYGRKNSKGFIKLKSKVGMTTIVEKYSGSRSSINSIQ